MKYVIYIRVSTKEQKISPEDQLDKCLAVAGNAEKRIFMDIGRSGGLKYENRKRLQEAINALEKGDVLLCHKPDRLARSQEVGIIYYFVRQKGATIQFADGSKTTYDSANDYIQVGIMNTIAEWERLMIKERTKNSIQKKIANGERTGTIPYGYRLSRDMIHIEKDPPEQETLQKLINWRSSGYSYREIVKLANDAGLKSRSGKPWGLKVLYKILKRQNIQMPLDRLHEGQFPLLSSEEKQPS